VGAIFKLVQKSNPETYFETHQESFSLGKSDKCEIVLPDPEVADIQARVGKKDEKYWIKNMAKKPILVNGRPALVQFIKNGDEITLGKTEFLLQLAAAGTDFDKTAKFEAQTMVLSGRPEQVSGPRLVCTNSAGKSKSYPLKKDKIVIGRSGEAHLKLVHPLISRKHCVIEKRDDTYVVRNISTTNPVIFNDHDISEKRLYAGDELKIGTFTVTFISDRPEDVRVVKEKIVTQNRRPVWGLLVATLLLFALGGYFLFLHAYTPWKISQTLLAVSKQIDAENYTPAQKTLKNLLKKNLSTEHAHEARELLDQTVLEITRQLSDSEGREMAKEYLNQHLTEYGASKRSVLWDRLDYYRLVEGQEYEDAKQFDLALKQYASIREEGLHYEEAQKAIRRIWLAYQQPTREEQTLAQLLKEAENHFRARRYLTPVNQNAYSVYQAVLALEPQHRLALQRIEQIKLFYRELGENYFKNKRWHKALTFLERLNFIDPNLPDVKDKIKICRNKLIESKKPPKKKKSKKTSKKTKKNESQEEIVRMLEESGTESSWLMEYLFEEQDGEPDSDTPW
jgi:pSer/pThr/pTyr-binding forkhead associated (FHA) protein